MKRFALALPVALLAAWAVVSHRGPAAPTAPVELTSGVADRDVCRVLKQFYRLRNSPPDASEPLRRLDEERRLLREALTLLDASRERLVAEREGKKHREQGALVPQARGRNATADGAKPIDDPPRGDLAARGLEPLTLAPRPKAGAAGKVTHLRLVIGTPEALSASAGAYAWDAQAAAATPPPAPAPAGATLTATRAAFPVAAAGMAAGHANLPAAAEPGSDALRDSSVNTAAPAPTSWSGSATLAATRAARVVPAAGAGVTAGRPPSREVVEHEIDALLDRVAALESRFGSLACWAGVSHAGPDVTIVNPPPVPTVGAPPTHPDALTSAMPPQPSAGPAVGTPRTAVERKFDTLRNLVRSMERHLAALEETRPGRSN
jgi:hypothetical protein